MAKSVDITTSIHNVVTGEEKLITQTITLSESEAELIYSVKGSDHVVRVGAEEYVGKLRELTGL